MLETIWWPAAVQGHHETPHHPKPDPWEGALLGFCETRVRPTAGVVIQNPARRRCPPKQGSAHLYIAHAMCAHGGNSVPVCAVHRIAAAGGPERPVTRRHAILVVTTHDLAISARGFSALALYRFSAEIIGRGKGYSATAAAAYRAGERIEDERTGEVHDYRRRDGVLHTEILAPEGAPAWARDRAKLWNAVEQAERRRDAQLSRQLILALPHELTDAQRQELVRDFVQREFVSRGMVADLAIHAPDREGDARNHHAHVMLTMRRIEGNGFGNKERGWNDDGVLRGWRYQWARFQNRALERAGHNSRVDHRSYADQGIDREPTQHLGKWAHRMEKAGKKSRIGEQNRQVQARNAERAQREHQFKVISLEAERE
ncbi:MAG: MobA/MobL family protein, partial [Novosphingobium sp.]|nr:MobA/MobL family protein [Novosphingobium sp.]